MKRKILIILCVVSLFGLMAFTDSPYARRIYPVATDPTCTENQIWYNMTTHLLKICTNLGAKTIPVGSVGITNSASLNTIPKSIDGSGNLGSSQITDDGSVVTLRGSGAPEIQLNPNTSELIADSGQGVTRIGDINSAGNGTTLTLDDSGQKVTIIGALEVGSTVILDSNLTSNGEIILASGDLYPTGTGVSLGALNSAGHNPFSSLYLGTTAFASQLTGTFTGNRIATLPDKTGTIGILLSNSATLDFGNLAAIGCEDLTITVTGAATGDTVSLAIPNGSVTANGYYPSPWVSAADTVTIRYCALVSGNPASGSFKVDVWKH